jgi:hypothetical protein
VSSVGCIDSYGWVYGIVCDQGAVGFPVDTNVQDWEVAFFFCIHCELYLLM